MRDRPVYRRSYTLDPANRHFYNNIVSKAYQWKIVVCHIPDNPKALIVLHFFFFIDLNSLLGAVRSLYVSSWSLSLHRRVFCHFKPAPCLHFNPHKFPFTLKPQRTLETHVLQNQFSYYFLKFQIANRL